MFEARNSVSQKMTNPETAVDSLAFDVSIVSFSEDTEQLKLTLNSTAVALNRLCKIGHRIIPRITIVNNRCNEDMDSEEFRHLLASLADAEIGLSIIQGHGNIGYGKAHNLAFKTDQVGYHLFLNPDVEVDEDALSVGLDYLEAFPEVGMVSPSAIGPKGQKQFLCKRFPAIFDLFLRGFMPHAVKAFFSRRLARYEMQELSDSEPASGIPIVSGCFMLCRSQPLAEVKGFDPEYFLYFEDFDLSLRLGAISNIAYLPDMKIRHWGGQSANKGLWHIVQFVRSGVRFYSRHGWRWFKTG